LSGGVAGKTWDQDLGLRLAFRVRISELVASAKSYPHSLNSFLLENADLICHFWPLDPLSVGEFSPARL
jgi:hypothetical protein